MQVLGKVGLKKYGLDSPAITVKISDGRNTSTIIIGDGNREKTRYYAADAGSGLVFTIVDKAFEAANVRLSQLAALRIFPLGREYDSLSVCTGKVRLSAVQEEREKEGKKR